MTYSPQIGNPNPIKVDANRDEIRILSVALSSISVTKKN